MRLTKLTVEGLFSYSKKQSIEFSDRVVIVGPNNAGKSNLFRIIDILADTLSGRSRLLDSQISESDDNPHVEAEIYLSPNEIDILADFLACGHSDKDNSTEMIEMPKMEKIKDCLDEITIKIDWEKTPDGSAGGPDIEIQFPKCGFGCKGQLDNSLQVVPLGIPYTETDYGHVELNEVIRDAFQTRNPKDAVQQFFQSNRPIHHPVNFDTKQLDARSRPKVLDLAHRLNSAGGTVSLPRLFGIVLGRIVHATENRNLLQDAVKEMFAHLQLSAPGRFEFETNYNRELLDRLKAYGLEPADRLENDGRNIAQLLFRLKNSPTLSDTERYRTIKGRFERLFSDQQLTIEPIVEYSTVERPVDGRATFPQTRLVIADANLSQHLPLGQVGAGVRGVIYLLAAVHGTKDSIVMLDEPGVNLHPTILQEVMEETNAQGSGNQVFVITHSPDLLRYEMTREDSCIVRIGTVCGRSTVSQDIEKTASGDPRLSSLIDPAVFFAKRVILTEGKSDRIILDLADRLDPKRRYNLQLNSIAVVSVDGKLNFRLYRKLLHKYGIPWNILADEDAKDEFEEDQVSRLCENRIEGDGQICLITKDLEEFMKKSDPDVFSEADAKHRSKVGKALEYAKLKLEKNPDGEAGPLAEFLRRCVRAANPNAEHANAPDRSGSRDG